MYRQASRRSNGRDIVHVRSVRLVLGKRGRRQIRASVDPEMRMKKRAVIRVVRRMDVERRQRRAQGRQQDEREYRSEAHQSRRLLRLSG